MSNELATLGDALPGFLKNGNSKINDDVATSAPYPHLSIKGKRFTVVKDGVKTVLMHPERPHEVAQTINLVIQRANMKAKVFYAEKYESGGSDGQTPDCYSMDGEMPAKSSRNPQNDGKGCATCPRNVWGSRDGKGRECSDQVRLAVAPAGALEQQMLLRVPPASIKPFKDAVKGIKAKGGQYNAVVYRVGFDIEAESPKLTFTPVSWVSQAEYAKIDAAYESNMVREIVGLIDNGAENATPPEQSNNLDAAPSYAAKADAPAPAPAAEAKPKPDPAPAPAPKPAPAPASSAATEAVMNDLDSILGNLDD